MNRDEWTVQYRGLALAGAALDKKTHHQGRLEWWKNKKAEVIEKIRSEGIEVSESIVDELGKAGYANATVASMNVTRGYRDPVVQIDAALQAHLREAVAKVHEHEGKARAYDCWEQMMTAQPAAASTFDLTHDDWMF